MAGYIRATRRETPWRAKSSASGVTTSSATREIAPPLATMASSQSLIVGRTQLPTSRNRCAASARKLARNSHSPGAGNCTSALGGAALTWAEPPAQRTSPSANARIAIRRSASRTAAAPSRPMSAAKVRAIVGTTKSAGTVLPGPTSINAAAVPVATATGANIPSAVTARPAIRGPPFEPGLAELGLQPTAPPSSPPRAAPRRSPPGPAGTPCLGAPIDGRAADPEPDGRGAAPFGWGGRRDVVTRRTARAPGRRARAAEPGTRVRVARFTSLPPWRRALVAFADLAVAGADIRPYPRRAC